MTASELDAAVLSLRRVGGLYELLADLVEADNRAHVDGAA